MKLPLASTLKNRYASTAKDARLLNAVVDIKNAGQKDAVAKVSKRPALEAIFDAIEGGDGFGQGLFTWTTPSGPVGGAGGGPGGGGGSGFGDGSGTYGDHNQRLVGIQNDKLNTSPTTKTKRLAFTVQPINWKIITAMTPSAVVTARDAFGNTMTSYTGTITIALAANPASGTLSGTLSVAASAGVATFSNLKLDNVGGRYKLRATGSGLSTATSTVFKIVSTLRFTTQPPSGPKDAAFTAVVSAVDSSDAVITGYERNVTVAIKANPASPAGVLSGTLTKAAVAGVATFDDLQIDRNADGYTLEASESA